MINQIYTNQHQEFWFVYMFALLAYTLSIKCFWEQHHISVNNRVEIINENSSIVNNAGIAPEIEGQTAETLTKAMETNFFGTAALTKGGCSKCSNYFHQVAYLFINVFNFNY